MAIPNFSIIGLHTIGCNCKCERPFCFEKVLSAKSAGTTGNKHQPILSLMGGFICMQHTLKYQQQIALLPWEFFLLFGCTNMYSYAFTFLYVLLAGFSNYSQLFHDRHFSYELHEIQQF
jgi:hypothetical protein